MRIGYACQCLNKMIPSFRTCTKKYVTEELLINIIAHNLQVLDQILDYNNVHSIYLFRISSDIIPFGSSPINTIDWRTMFKTEFQELGEKVKNYGMRVTMHPGQYTILNTPNEDVLRRSVDDLRYHCDILNLMEMDQTNKLILHVGGIYGEKKTAMQRFIKAFFNLDEDIRQRLIIENDDRYYTLADVLSLSKCLHIPVIFDNLHHSLLPSLIDHNLKEILNLVKATWKVTDGRMKIHYSQQDITRRKGAHAFYLNNKEFIDFCESISFLDIDVMMEIKSKNLAALQAIDLLDHEHFNAYSVWNCYRYLILRYSLEIYTELEDNLEHKSVEQFYELIYQALSLKLDDGSFCYQKIYDEWEPLLEEKNRIKLKKALARFQQQKLSEEAIKRAFFSIALFVNQQDSYLFL